jgi:chromosome segregation ATPase
VLYCIYRFAYAEPPLYPWDEADLIVVYDLSETEDRVSELEDEMVTKGKTEELLVKQLKTFERNMQELTDSIKRPNLRIMGIEERE